MTPHEILSLIIAIVGILTGVGGWASSRSAAKKSGVDTLRGIIAELRHEIDEEREARQILTEDNHELWRGTLILLGQLKDAKVKPNWQPTKRILDRYSHLTVDDTSGCTDSKGLLGNL